MLRYFLMPNRMITKQNSQKFVIESDLFSPICNEISNSSNVSHTSYIGGWSGGAMVLGKLPVPGRPTIWITVGQGPTALSVGAGGGCLDIFTLIYPFFPLSPSLCEMA